MKARRVLVVIGAVLVAAAVPAPAEADGGLSLSFVGVAGLPEFPCLPDEGEPACSGSFAGSISGQLAGEKFGAWEATLGDAILNATFTYNDAEGHCTTGVAEGTATVTAGVGQVIGLYKRPPLLPAQIRELWAQVDFTWERVGSTANLTLTNGRVRLDVDGLGWVQVMSGSVGDAAAAFLPEFDLDNMPDCVEFTHSPPLTATVVGTAALADPM